MGSAVGKWYMDLHCSDRTRFVELDGFYQAVVEMYCTRVDGADKSVLGQDPTKPGLPPRVLYVKDSSMDMRGLSSESPTKPMGLL